MRQPTRPIAAWPRASHDRLAVVTPPSSPIGDDHGDGRSVRVPAGVTRRGGAARLGVTAFRRSVRGEPRGPLCGMGTCYECRVTIDGVAHRRSCLVPVAEGMRDAAPRTRSRPATSSVSGGYGGVAVHVDVAVIGAGPAGIAAAARAAEAGRRVVLLDEAPNAGGQIWRHRSRRDARRRRAAVDRPTVANEQPTSGSGVAVVDVIANGGDGGFTVVAERHAGGAVDVVRAPALVVATGARERFLPFPGWTLPGVLGIGGAQALLEAGHDVPRQARRDRRDGAAHAPRRGVAHRRGCARRARRRAGVVSRRFAISRSRCSAQPDTLVQAAMYRLGVPPHAVRDRHVGHGRDGHRPRDGA